jgi:hypothetical protein
MNRYVLQNKNPKKKVEQNWNPKIKLRKWFADSSITLLFVQTLSTNINKKRGHQSVKLTI